LLTAPPSAAALPSSALSPSLSGRRVAACTLRSPCLAAHRLHGQQLKRSAALSARSLLLLLLLLPLLLLLLLAQWRAFLRRLPKLIP
jgi:hypothetical protein